MLYNPSTAHTKLFAAAFAVSFIGSIPIGSISATSLQMSVSGNTQSALLFALAAVMVETLLVWVLLKHFRFCNANIKFSKYIYVLAIALFCALGCYILLNPSDNDILQSSVQNYSSAFLLGIMVSALNPFQVPYWLVWNRIFHKKRLLQQSAQCYSCYVLAIGLGSFVVLYLYILCGTLIAEYYATYSRIINLIFGYLYLGIAGYLSFDFYKKHYLTKMTNV